MGSTDGIAGAFYCFVLPLVVCLLILGFAVPISSLVYGGADDVWPCIQEPTLSIATWLVVFGTVSISSLVVVAIVVGISFCSNWSGKATTCITVVPMIVFHAIWAVYGSDLVWNSNYGCNYTAGVEAIAKADIIIEFILCAVGTIAVAVVLNKT